MQGRKDFSSSFTAFQVAGLRIYEVADACGYPNVIYFSRVFAKSNGMTPQDYRKLHLKK